MKVSEAIKVLEALQVLHGDCEVMADCASCGHETPVGIVVVKVPKLTVRLQESKK